MQQGGAHFTQPSGVLIHTSSHWGSLCLPISHSCSHATPHRGEHRGQWDDIVFPISSIPSSCWTTPHNLSVHASFSNPLYPCTTWDSAYASASPPHCEFPIEQRIGKRMINFKNYIWAYSPLLYPWNSDSEHVMYSFAQQIFQKQNINSLQKRDLWWLQSSRSHLGSAHRFPVKFGIRLWQRKCEGLWTFLVFFQIKKKLLRINTIKTRDLKKSKFRPFQQLQQWKGNRFHEPGLNPGTYLLRLSLIFLWLIPAASACIFISHNMARLTVFSLRWSTEGIQTQRIASCFHVLC